MPVPFCYIMYVRIGKKRKINKMLMLNPTETPVLVRLRMGAIDHVWVQPGETIEIDDKYAHPRLAENGGRRPSVIEEVAPQLVPANDEDKADWSKAPSFTAPQKPGTYIPSVAELVKLGTPPGIAVKMVEQAMASAAEQLKAYQETEVLKIKDHVKNKKEGK